MMQRKNMLIGLSNKLCLCAGLLTCLWTVAATADSVQLDNGDVLHGKVVTQNQQHVTLEHPTLGILELKVQNVVKVVIDPLPGKAEGQLPDETVGQPVPMTPVASENPKPLDTPDTSDTSDTPATPTPQPTLLAGWKSQFELGSSGTAGNTRNNNLRIALTSKKESDTDRWLFSSQYHQTDSEGESTRKEGQMLLSREWFKTGSPWFSFGKGVFDYDEFRPWVYRATGHVGAGYQIVKSDQLELSAKVGLGAAKELEGAKAFRPELLININLAKWAITKKQYLAGDLTVYPNLEDPGEYRAVGKIEWVADLDSAQGLKLKLGIEDEYESITKGDFRHNDFKYYATLVLDF